MSAIKLFSPPDEGGAPAPPKGFAPMPHAVTSSAVSDRAFRVLAGVLFFARGRPETDVTDVEIGAFLGRSRESISRGIKELVSAGLLVRRTAGPVRFLAFGPALSASDLTRSERSDSASDLTHKRVNSDALARQMRHTSASDVTRPSYGEGEKENSEKPAASAGGRAAPPPPPAKRADAPPKPSAAAPPSKRPPGPALPRPSPPKTETPPAEAVLCPEEVVFLESIAGEPMAKIALANHHRAVAWYSRRGLDLPDAPQTQRGEWRGYLARLGLPLPVGDERGEKKTGGGTLAKVSPPPVPR